MGAPNLKSTMTEDLRRMAPVWGIVAGTAIIAALSLRYTAVWHLRNTALAEENACTFADVYYTAAGNLMPDIFDKVADLRAAEQNFDIPSLGDLAGDPLALEARGDLLKAIEICPDHKLARRMLSHIEWQLGNELAADVYLGDFYRLDKQPEAALMAYEMAAAIDHTDPNLTMGRALALLALKRNTEALEVVEQNEAALSETTAGKLALGRVLGAAGASARAETYLREGLVENPSDTAALLEFYWVSRRQEKWREGADFLMGLGADGKKTVTQAYHLAAGMYRQVGDSPMEEKALEKALELFPNNVNIRWEYAVCLFDQGKKLAARDQLLRTMDYNSNFVLERLKGSPLAPLVQ